MRIYIEFVCNDILICPNSLHPSKDARNGMKSNQIVLLITLSKNQESFKVGASNRVLSAKSAALQRARGILDLRRRESRHPRRPVGSGGALGRHPEG
mmetsp:Transcript_5365/g.13486  ORF Transcript_5365/g.13486 Transcript_5365/m.13486 type:complete len:97 (-) Transcript_5365:1869-2159(-)